MNDPDDNTSSFFCDWMYKSMLPAIFVVPLWFGRGRLLMGGTLKFMGSFYIDYLAMPGVVFFHVLVFWWEGRQRRQRQCETAAGAGAAAAAAAIIVSPKLCIAASLLMNYLMHIAFQIFFVDENIWEGREGWSVASRYFGVTKRRSRHIAGFLAVIIWVDMIWMLLLSYFTPDHDNGHDDDQQEQTSIQTTMTRTKMELLRERMYNALRPCVAVAPLWFAAGHSLLGGGYGWGAGILFIYGSLLIFLPFHFVLWRRERNEAQVVSPHMAVALCVYFVLHFFFQIFVWEGFRSGASVATHYFGLGDDLSMLLNQVLMRMIGINMIAILCLSYFKRKTIVPSSNGSLDTNESLQNPLLKNSTEQ